MQSVSGSHPPAPLHTSSRFSKIRSSGKWEATSGYRPDNERTLATIDVQNPATMDMKVVYTRPVVVVLAPRMLWLWRWVWRMTIGGRNNDGRRDIAEGQTSAYGFRGLSYSISCRIAECAVVGEQLYIFQDTLHERVYLPASVDADGHEGRIGEAFAERLFWELRRYTRPEHLAQTGRFLLAGLENLLHGATGIWVPVGSPIVLDKVEGCCNQWQPSMSIPHGGWHPVDIFAALTDIDNCVNDWNNAGYDTEDLETRHVGVWWLVKIETRSGRRDWETWVTWY